MRRLYREILFWSCIIYGLVHIFIAFINFEFVLAWLISDIVGAVISLLCYVLCLFYKDVIRGK